MADEPIDLAHRRSRKADMASRYEEQFERGELLFTVYHYEKSHIIHWPDTGEISFEDYRLVRDKMYLAAHNQADTTYERTGADEDFMLLAAIFYGTSLSTYFGDPLLSTWEQALWLERQFKHLLRDKLPPFRVTFHNDNAAKETTDEDR